MGIIDCIMFNGEWDALEIRLRELQDVVTETIIFEGNVTFRGDPKPLYYSGGSLMFHQVRRVIVDLRDVSGCKCCQGIPFTHTMAWRREAHLRNQAKWFIDGHDFAIVTDCDEVPRANIVNAIVSTYTSPTRLLMDNFAYNFHWISPGQAPTGFIAAGVDLHNCHYQRHEIKKAMPYAGWHLSNFGDTEFLKRKLQSFAHEEYDSPEFLTDEFLRQCVEEGKAPFGQYTYIEPNPAALPAWIPEKYR